VVADRQTRGRGRLERRWHSPPAENLYLSLVLKRRTGPPSPAWTNLTQYASLILSDVLRDYEVRPAIKWPNDLLVGERKIAGILAEAVSSGSVVQGVVLGMGVNLNMGRRDLEEIDQPATSLAVEVGGKVDRWEFLDRILELFFAGFDAFVRDGFSSIRARFLEQATFLGRRITVRSGLSDISGTASDITADGALIVVSEQGERVKLTSGDVQCFRQVSS
jgi:BirA family biotin operon repressor/biotin-[acetyl-CoA-carboxylase] ligase